MINMKKLYLLAAISSIFTAAGSVNAATVFAPTDGDVNFLFGTLSQGTTLAIFDDSDQSYLGPSLEVAVPSIVGFVGPVNANGDYIATDTLGTLTLSGNSSFILGLNVGGTWFADSSVVSNGANAYTVTFDTNGSVLQVDVQIIPSVPLPAAIWLFGSGLLGLAGLAGRRRTA